MRVHQFRATLLWLQNSSYISVRAIHKSSQIAIAGASSQIAAAASRSSQIAAAASRSSQIAATANSCR